jgi:hypothetical protein
MFAATGALFGVIAVIWLLALGSLIVGVAAIISVASTPTEAFGPWWDNTRQTWLIGIVVSFLIPFGHLITGIMWFTSGREPLRKGLGYAGRPFWAGPSRPPPMGPPPGWGYPPPGPPPPAPPR